MLPFSDSNKLQQLYGMIAREAVYICHYAVESCQLPYELLSYLTQCGRLSSGRCEVASAAT